MNEIKAGTLGGTLCVLLTSLTTDLLRTTIISAVGAIVSYTISMLLNHLRRKPDK